ncbi:hypothetical protein Dimus_032563 [Dionaea muscipula]
MAKHEELPIQVYSTLDCILMVHNLMRLSFALTKSNPNSLKSLVTIQRSLLDLQYIDYEGYSVLPLAIRQDTIVAIRKHDVGDSEKILRISNLNDAKYPTCIYPADPDH